MGIVLLAPGLHGIHERDIGRIGIKRRVGTGYASAHSLLEGLDGTIVKRRRRAREAVMPHERKDLFGAQLFSQTLGTVFVRLAPILIEIELAIAIGIAERKPGHLDHARGVGDAYLCSAVRIDIARPAVPGLLRGVFRLDIRAIRLDRVLVRRGRSILRAAISCGGASSEPREPCSHCRRPHEIPSGQHLFLFSLLDRPSHPGCLPDADIIFERARTTPSSTQDAVLGTQSAWQRRKRTASGSTCAQRRACRRIPISTLKKGSACTTSSW